MFLPRMLTPLLSVRVERDRLHRQWIEWFEALSGLDADAKSALRPTVEEWARALAPVQALWTYVALFCAFLVLCAFAVLGLLQVTSLVPLTAEYRALVSDLNRAYIPVLALGYGLLWLVVHTREIKTGGRFPAAAVGLHLLAALHFLDARRGEALDAESKRLVVGLLESAAVALDRHMTRFVAQGDVAFGAEARERFRNMAAGLRVLKLGVVFGGGDSPKAQDQLAGIVAAWALGNWADLPISTPRRVSWAGRFPVLYKLWIGLCAACFVVGIFSIFKTQAFPSQAVLVLPFLITALFDKRTGEVLKSLLDVLERIRGSKQ
ncbi:hypothetical protein [uncultured Meiothermus sp.]|uniref:hypothetical protein n=1 Tax=uncultured Meiothermus sp. TaxID=157471 RepID=UPI00262E92A5|nr:hypothetical protein [uncultured Meiothermus sp.]